MPPRSPLSPAAVDLSAGERARLIAAAQAIQACRRELAGRDGSVIGEAMGASLPVAWRHYPEEEVYDPASHAQYFYHSHPADAQGPREHGHFHIFLRAEGMPVGVAPLVLPEIAVASPSAVPVQAAPLKRGARDEIAHLIAIAVDPRGEPVRLFTTNRWVTGETWYRADDVAAMLERFTVGGDEPSAVLNRWVGAVIDLFRSDIVRLLRARDARVMSWRRRRRTHVFEDPRLEVTSSLDIDLDARLALVEALRTAGAAPTRSPSLPRMAEGWGEDHPG